MTETLESVQDDFRKLLNDLTGVYGFATLGITYARKTIAKSFSGADPDSKMALFDGDPRDDATVGYQHWRMADVHANLAENGMITISLGQQWIVNIYAHWEHEYRNRFAAAKGFATVDEYKEPIFGDMRLIRNDIVHNGGVAEACDRAEELKWFQNGDAIAITNDHVKDFMERQGQTFSP